MRRAGPVCVALACEVEQGRGCVDDRKCDTVTCVSLCGLMDLASASSLEVTPFDRRPVRRPDAAISRGRSGRHSPPVPRRMSALDDRPSPQAASLIRQPPSARTWEPLHNVLGLSSDRLSGLGRHRRATCMHPPGVVNRPALPPPSLARDIERGYTQEANAPAPAPRRPPPHVRPLARPPVRSSKQHLLQPPMHSLPIDHPQPHAHLHALSPSALARSWLRLDVRRRNVNASLTPVGLRAVFALHVPTRICQPLSSESASRRACSSRHTHAVNLAMNSAFSSTDATFVGS